MPSLDWQGGAFGGERRKDGRQREGLLVLVQRRTDAIGNWEESRPLLVKRSLERLEFPVSL